MGSLPLHLPEQECNLSYMGYFLVIRYLRLWRECCGNHHTRIPAFSMRALQVLRRLDLPPLSRYQYNFYCVILVVRAPLSQHVAASSLPGHRTVITCSLVQARPIQLLTLKIMYPLVFLVRMAAFLTGRPIARFCCWMVRIPCNLCMLWVNNSKYCCMIRQRSRHLEPQQREYQEPMHYFSLFPIVLGHPIAAIFFSSPGAACFGKQRA